MAALVRSLCRQGRNSISYISKRRVPPTTAVPILKQHAFISTSKKDKGIGVSVEPMEQSEELKRLTEHFGNTDKNNEENYTSYGYEPGDRDTDWFLHHMVMFCTITIGVVGGSYIIAYMPEVRFNDWTQREAFLELDRRERLGLPLVDRNYVDPKYIELPSDEEIGDTEIII